MQRATGDLMLVLRRRGTATVLADLRQEGCQKLRFPRGPGFEAVTLNTAGGVAGGDRLRTCIQLGVGSSAIVSTQAAERFYRARDEDEAASVVTAVTLAEGAELHWLPQEAIFFDGSRVARRLDVAMADDARFLGVEALLFGRVAMGEALRAACIADTIAVRRGGRLVFHDTVRLAGDVAAMLARPAVASGGAAAATLVLVAPDSGTRLDALRAALDEAPVEAGASAWDGMLVARLVARDGDCLRRGIVAGLAALRDGRPLPRVWMC